MRTTPLNYQDYLETNPQGDLPLATELSEEGKHRAACVCRPDFMQRALVIVDCRHLDKNIVPQDWACQGCWSKWVRASGSKENLFDIVKNTQDIGNASLRSEVAQATKFNKHPNRTNLQNVLVEAKEKGELHMTFAKRECFTFTLWLEMHGVENPERCKNTKYDFLP